MRLLDSFAWIEYFSGSERGAKVRSYVDDLTPLYTPSICLTEIKSRYLRENKDPTKRLELIIERSFIIPLDIEIALLAAEMKKEYRLHTVDAIIYATSQRRRLILVTGDAHFKGLPNVEII
ncbi:MAG: type II toxin-antitoxin system VapC family toxin [Candidatus Bathyarchaeia archaeon]